MVKSGILKKILCMLALLSIIIIVAVCASEQICPEPPANQTVMIYMVGSDLESENGAASLDIEEMLNAEINDGINVLLMTGGAKQWHSEISNNAVSVFQIVKNELVCVDSLDSQSMGNAQTLSYFLNFGFENYPASSYGLILWDHGMGPVGGFGADELYDGDALLLDELREALYNSVFSAENKLEWIGMDACLMSSLETACALRDYSNYMIASQEAIPRYGWNYKFLEDLFKTQFDGREISELIINSYFDFYAQLNSNLSNYKPDLTMACLALPQLESFINAMDDLFALINANWTDLTYADSLQRRFQCKTFGKFTTGIDLDLIDLKSFLYTYSDCYASEALLAIDALDKLVVYNRANIDGANGLSAFYPFDSKPVYMQQGEETLLKLVSADNYCRYYQMLIGTVHSKQKAVWDNMSLTVAKQSEGNTDISLQLSPEQLALYADSVVYYVQKCGDGIYRLSMASGDTHISSSGLVTAHFDGNLLYLTDEDLNESEVFPCLHPVTFNFSSRYLAEGVVLDLKSLNSELVWIQVDMTRGAEPEIVGAVYNNNFDTALATFGKQDFDLSAWDYLEFVYILYEPAFDEYGNWSSFEQWTVSENLVGILDVSIDHSFYLEYLPADEEVLAVILVRDIYNNTYYSIPTSLG